MLGLFLDMVGALFTAGVGSHKPAKKSASQPPAKPRQLMDNAAVVLAADAELRRELANIPLVTPNPAAERLLNLRTDLIARIKVIERDTAEFDRLSTLHAQQEKQATALHGETITLRQQRFDIGQKITVLDPELISRKQLFSEADKELRAIRARIQKEGVSPALTAQLKILGKYRNQCQRELNAVTKSIKALEAQGNTLNTRLDEIENDKGKLNVAIDKFVAYWQKNVSEQGNLGATKNQLEIQLAGVNQQLKALAAQPAPTAKPNEPAQPTPVKKEAAPKQAKPPEPKPTAKEMPPVKAASAEQPIKPAAAAVAPPLPPRSAKQVTQPAPAVAPTIASPPTAQPATARHTPHSAMSAITTQQPKTAYDRRTALVNLYENLMSDPDKRIELFSDIRGFNTETSGSGHAKQVKFTSIVDSNIAITVDSKTVSATTLPIDQAAKQSLIQSMVAIYLKSIAGSEVLAHKVDGDPAIKMQIEKALAKQIHSEIAQHPSGKTVDAIKINGHTVSDIVSGKAYEKPVISAVRPEEPVVAKRKGHAFDPVVK